MNRSIRFAAIFALLLTVILMVNLTRIQVFSEERYAQNGLNKRQFFEMKSIPRGQISTGGLTLAHSVQGADGFYQREYVTNPVQYGPVEGYLSDIYGASGIESSYNGILNGDDPSLFAAQWKDVILGREKKGANVELTLVPEVQDVAYQQLSSKGYAGAVVAIRPKTGEVLAMASTPSFDPSSIVNPETAENSWAELTSDSDSPLLNHATQGLLGTSRPVQLISGYRSIDTNNELRAHSRGVAKKSYHTKGQAMDFHIEGVSLANIRKAALSMRAGGVGYYPSSNFVHIDTGPVRHW